VATKTGINTAAYATTPARIPVVIRGPRRAKQAGQAASDEKPEYSPKEGAECVVERCRCRPDVRPGIRP
jgi:hypothetical protein